MTVNLNDAISYNCIVELRNVMRMDPKLSGTSLIAVALKSRKILIILLAPNFKEEEEDPVAKQEKESDESQPNYFILKTIPLDTKPTCLVQLSRRHLAVATGFLAEKSKIEVINIFSGLVVTSVL